MTNDGVRTTSTDTKMNTKGESSNVKWLMGNDKGERWKPKVKVEKLEVGGEMTDDKCQMTNIS